MKKNFFLKLTVLLILVQCTIFIYTTYYPLLFCNPNCTKWIFNKEILQKKIPIPSNVKVLILGDSRVNAGINIDNKKDYFSFASGGATSIEMYYILKKYLENIAKPDTIFLSISPRFLTEIFGFWDYAVAYSFFDNGDIQEIIKNYYKNDLDYTLGNLVKLKYWTYQLKYIGYYQADIYRNYLFRAKNKNREEIDFMIGNNGRQAHPGLADSCSDLNFETRFQVFKPSEILDLYLIELLNLCSRENIFVFWKAMPMNRSSYNKLNDEFVADYKNYFRNLAHKYSEFYISDSLYFYDNKYFGDNSHLNKNGMEKFSNEIFKKL